MEHAIEACAGAYSIKSIKNCGWLGVWLCGWLGGWVGGVCFGVF